MFLIRRQTDSKLKCWQDETGAHVVQERPDGTHYYQVNGTLLGSAITPEQLAAHFGFTLVGKLVKGEVLDQVNTINF